MNFMCSNEATQLHVCTLLIMYLHAEIEMENLEILFTFVKGACIVISLLYGNSFVSDRFFF